jgi:hypothetical protein
MIASASSTMLATSASRRVMSASPRSFVGSLLEPAELSMNNPSARLTAPIVGVETMRMKIWAQEML